MGRICMLLAEEFEDSECAIPRARLESRGHELMTVGSAPNAVVSGEAGHEVVFLDRGADQVSARDFDAVVIPGGRAPEMLRADSRVITLLRSAAEAGRIIAAVCHGPQLLIEAGLSSGRTLTSWPTLRTDLENSGAKWVDMEVCIDENLITSRSPSDLEPFCRAILDALAARVESFQRCNEDQPRR